MRSMLGLEICVPAGLSRKIAGRSSEGNCWRTTWTSSDMAGSYDLNLAQMIVYFNSTPRKGDLCLKLDYPLQRPLQMRCVFRKSNAHWWARFMGYWLARLLC